jgi:hypothetical protein
LGFTVRQFHARDVIPAQAGIQFASGIEAMA